MCLIISGKASQVRSTLLDTHGLLNDIYTSNPDGIGFMYGSTSGLKVVKSLPKTLGDAFALIRRMPHDDRDIAIHFRWTTHGHTDLLNCHPYDVVPGFVAMMHNGVLHTGNNADKSKSDTWHFIRDYLASAVRAAPNLVHDKGFLDMVGEFIDNNRFVFMDGEGKMSIVNRDQGVEHDGMWFSNTYAWKPSRLIPNYQSSYKYGGKTYRSYANGYGIDEDEYDDHYGSWTNGFVAGASTHPQEQAANADKKFSAHDPRWSEEDSEWEQDTGGYEAVDLDPPKLTELETAMMECDVELLDDWMSVYPAYTLRQLFGHMKPVKTPTTSVEDLARDETTVYQAAFADDVEALITFATRSEHARVIVSEVLCYYMFWQLRTPVRMPIPALLTQ